MRKVIMFNTRIAPSPTGDMHMGTAITAYFNWLAARSTGGKFILRIDDTDLDRSDSSKTDDILKVMDWLKLDYDEIIYQSDRFDRYKQIADTLVIHDLAVSDGNAIRLNQLRDIPIQNNVWHDELAGDISIDDSDRSYFNNMVIFKSDGSPTYNFASVVDDIDYNINHVIRGVDHIKNTAKQVMLYQALSILSARLNKSLFDREVSIPLYTHVGLLFKDNKKLSKHHVNKYCIRKAQ